MDKIRNAKRIVIKVGTSTLCYKTGNLNIRRVGRLIEVMSDLKNQGKDIIFVTSGAVGIGVGKAGFTQRPKDMPTKKACSLASSASM